MLERGRQALERRACRGGLIEIDIEILDERAFCDALFDDEIRNRQRGLVFFGERHVGRGRLGLRLLFVIDADAEETVSMRCIVGQCV